MEINYLNLKRMFNHILLNVTSEIFKMNQYREEHDCLSHECQSTGCIIGHCIILDNWENVPLCHDDSIDFVKWSEYFIGFTYYDDNWLWCFSGAWYNYNSKEQALLRLKYLIDNQKVPDNWHNFDYQLPQQKLEPYEIN